MIVKDFLDQSAEVKQRLAGDQKFLDLWSAAANALKASTQAGGTIYLCGNGGSACDAMHFREELVARYKRDRPGIKAQHFVDGSTLTCWGNDYEYESLFEREANTFITQQDVLVGISTSGDSENVLRAVKVAKAKGAKTLGLLGKGGGKLLAEVDYPLVVPSEETDRIQEVHITLIHAFCEFLEN